MSKLEWRLARTAAAAVVIIVTWGFAQAPDEEPIVGSYVHDARLAPYREVRIRLSLEEDHGFAFGWIEEYDGTEEERGEVRGTWEEIDGRVQLTASWETGPFAAMRMFSLPGDRRVDLVGPGIPPFASGGASWVVRTLLRERR